MGSLVSTTANGGLVSFEVTGQVSHAATAAGCLGYIKNPEACDIIVTRAFLYGMVNSTGAANITVGNAATVAAAHDTTTLFAALSLLDGTVIGDCMPRHRHQEFIRFLKKIDAETPTELDLHLIVDNYATHKHPRVQSWLKKHPRWLKKPPKKLILSHRKQ